MPSKALAELAIYARLPCDSSVHERASSATDPFLEWLPQSRDRDLWRTSLDDVPADARAWHNHGRQQAEQLSADDPRHPSVGIDPADELTQALFVLHTGGALPGMMMC